MPKYVRIIFNHFLHLILRISGIVYNHQRILAGRILKPIYSRSKFFSYLSIYLSTHLSIHPRIYEKGSWVYQLQD